VIGRFVSVLILLSPAVSAATTVATVSSVGAVRVSGVEMSADTVASWPLVSGDVIEPVKGSAILILRDRSRVIVPAGSQIKIETDGDAVNVRVLSGSVDYALTRPESAKFFIASRPVPTSSLSGSVGARFGSEPGGGRRGTTNGNTPAVPPSASPTR
jgi:hypothetical protein